mmetsp:Transcript_23/g.35  ORF Transcript_23/g.35 Transcript_23/m.35 type:complete len:408 (-) Transcript_23:84-1307(-)
MHKKAIIGFSGSRTGNGLGDKWVAFRRDANGKLDENGEYATEKTVTHVKYEKEARFCFGVYMDKDDNGCRVKPVFEYTEKKLITRVDCNKLRLQAVALARSNLGKASTVWIENLCPQGAVYELESIQSIPKLKGKTAEKLIRHGIVLVKDLKALHSNDQQMKTIAAETHGMSYKRLSDFVKVVTGCCLPGEPPSIVDHRAADNPYQSKYGDSWEYEIDKICMIGSVCVMELIDFIFIETKHIYGTEGMVYHDALSLMTAKESVPYMKDQGYYDWWILPQNDLMSESGGVGGSLPSYRGCPVGNRPESNPLDTSLFSQLHRAVKVHGNISKHLSDDKKLSLATPSTISSGYKRVWEIGPQPETIAKDFNKVLDSFLVIAQHEGLAIDGPGDRSGRRHIPIDEQILLTC